MVLKIADLIPDEEIEVWVEYPFAPGFEVKFRHIRPERWRKLYRAATTFRYDPATHQRVEDVDDRKVNELISREVIRDWRGLTVGKLAEVTVTRIPDDVEVDPNEVLPYTPENAQELMNASLEFQNWVADVMTRVEQIARAQREAEAKNSKSSPDGTSSHQGDED